MNSYSLCTGYRRCRMALICWHSTHCCVMPHWGWDELLLSRCCRQCKRGLYNGDVLCLPFCLFVLSSKTKQFITMVSIDDQSEVLQGLSKDPILRPVGCPWVTVDLAACATENLDLCPRSNLCSCPTDGFIMSTYQGELLFIVSVVGRIRK